MRTVIALCAALSGASPAAADAPPAVAPRPGEQTVLRLRGVGVQIYRCRPEAGGASAWTFEAPRAELMLDGKPVGRHGAGPFWAADDGSRITGIVEAKAAAPDPASIPWLRLKVASRAGAGVLEPVVAVLRIDTAGGVKAGACTTPDAVFEAPYEATYVFLRQG